MGWIRVLLLESRQYVVRMNTIETYCTGMIRLIPEMSVNTFMVLA